MAKKINYEQGTTVKFEEIKLGEIFRYRNFIFIRIGTFFGYDSKAINAICLEDGVSEYFEETDNVQKVDTEINVKFIKKNF